MTSNISSSAPVLVTEDETRQLLEALCPGERIEATGYPPPNNRMLWEREQSRDSLPDDLADRIAAFDALDESTQRRFTDEATRLRREYRAREDDYDDAVHELWDSLLDKDNLRYPAVGAVKPDINFAVHESTMFLDWSKAGMVDVILSEKGVGEGFMNGMITDCNFVGILPNFCDGTCIWQEKSRHYYTWEDNAGEETDEDDECTTGIPFPRTHFENWSNTIRQELEKVEWGAAEEFNDDNTTTNDGGNGDGRRMILHEMRSIPARVRRWRSGTGGKHHRLEYWYTVEQGDTDYIILQTDGGKLLIVGVISGHPFLVCNLLNFGNSDGSSGRVGQPRLVQKIADAGTVVDAALEAAEQTLYQQIH